MENVDLLIDMEQQLLGRSGNMNEAFLFCLSGGLVAKEKYFEKRHALAYLLIFLLSTVDGYMDEGNGLN